MLCIGIVSFHYTTQGTFSFTDIFYKTKPNQIKSQQAKQQAFGNKRAKLFSCFPFPALQDVMDFD